MSGRLLFPLSILLAAAPLAAQSLEIHSEFQRIDPFGRTLPIDRSEYPREILSPELPRNAHSIFNISVTVPPNTSYFLYIGSNPGNIIQTTMYKEDFTKVGDQWIPDALSPLHMPSFGFMPDSAAEIPGQTTRCYLLDIWVPPDADVRRVRVEVLLKIGVWYVAPMEVRIVAAKVPPHPAAAPDDRPLPAIDARADLPAMDCLAAYLLGRPQTWTPEDLTLRSFIRRAAEQDTAIARLQNGVPQQLWFTAEDGILQWWMQNPAFRWSGAEWYLRARDWIYRNP